jgi:hypothetical protein
MLLMDTAKYGTEMYIRNPPYFSSNDASTRNGSLTEFSDFGRKIKRGKGIVFKSVSIIRIGEIEVVKCIQFLLSWGCGNRMY